MVTYIYFVKCPNCEDEHFDFFDDAKGFAMGCLSKKPIITQTEVCRNDFGECTDHCDLGTVWSWEDEMKDTETEEPGTNIFSKGDFGEYNPDNDPEFADDDFFAVNNLEETLVEDYADLYDRIKDMVFDGIIPGPVSQYTYVNNWGRMTLVRITDKGVEEVDLKKAYQQARERDSAEKPLTEGFTFSLNNAKDLEEFMKLCDEVGMKTVGDLDRFVKDTAEDEGTILDKLREYRAELGPDFKIKESSKKDISEGWYEDTHYEVGKGITKEELYDVLVNQNKTAMVNLGDCGETEVFFSDYSRYSDSELEIEWEGDDVFSIYEWFNSDDGDRTDGDYAFTANSFEELWAELCIIAPSFFADNTRKPVPEGMTVEQLVETMEENEDEVECTWCNDLFPKDMCKKEVNLGYLCPRCADGIMSRGETLTFKENNYWDFLDEKFDIDFEDEASSDMLDATSDAEADEFDLDYPEID